jgi:3-isopropylmalate/(R)-2-methylmalate dehydratase small subunit
MNRFEPIEAAAAPVAQPNVDTDQIIPARFLSRPREEGLAECLFRDLRFDATGAERPDFVLNQEGFRGAKLIVAERNFGCGSSRENAVWALYDYGIRAVIAPSTGDIFYNNCLKNGLLPVFLPPETCDDLIAAVTVSPGAKVGVDLASQTVVAPNGASHHFDIDPFAKECLLKGLDELAYTLSQVEEIAAFENRYGRENS